jgi:hypothetical protein
MVVGVGDLGNGTKNEQLAGRRCAYAASRSGGVGLAQRQRRSS